jgi:hypothetical protein
MLEVRIGFIGLRLRVESDEDSPRGGVLKGQGPRLKISDRRLSEGCFKCMCSPDLIRLAEVKTCA